MLFTSLRCYCYNWVCYFGYVGSYVLITSGLLCAILEVVFAFVEGLLVEVVNHMGIIENNMSASLISSSWSRSYLVSIFE